MSLPDFQKTSENNMTLNDLRQLYEQSMTENERDQLFKTIIKYQISFRHVPDIEL